GEHLAIGYQRLRCQPLIGLPIDEGSLIVSAHIVPQPGVAGRKQGDSLARGHQIVFGLEIVAVGVKRRATIRTPAIGNGWVGNERVHPGVRRDQPIIEVISILNPDLSGRNDDASHWNGSAAVVIRPYDSRGVTLSGGVEECLRIAERSAIGEYRVLVVIADR